MTKRRDIDKLTRQLTKLAGHSKRQIQDIGVAVLYLMLSELEREGADVAKLAKELSAAEWLNCYGALCNERLNRTLGDNAAEA